MFLYVFTILSLIFLHSTGCTSNRRLSQSVLLYNSNIFHYFISLNLISLNSYKFFVKCTGAVIINIPDCGLNKGILLYSNSHLQRTFSPPHYRWWKWLKCAFQFLLLRHETTIPENTGHRRLLGWLIACQQSSRIPRRSEETGHDLINARSPTVSNSPVRREAPHRPRTDRLFLGVWQETVIVATVMPTVQV